ncbi:DUF3618 domain-containing protein [Streptomyces caelestis]|uniref:DUF3618 domain-containing protein n=1 Tax=Streptomyces caelestis TaxID=36816 RepID=UPI003668D563
MTQPPHDEPTASSPQQLREQVERTRTELGKTVEVLAAKTDVKARAQEKATEVKEQAVARAGELKGQAALKSGELREKAVGLARQAQDRLPDPVKDKAVQAAEQARAKAVRAGRMWQDKAPEPVRRKTAQGARLARDNRKALLVATGMTVMVWLACRRGKE